VEAEGIAIGGSGGGGGGGAMRGARAGVGAGCGGRRWDSEPVSSQGSSPLHVSFTIPIPLMSAFRQHSEDFKRG
jgi:hypothetical protein